MLKGINIKTIPHELQRYPTCGDWYYSRDNVWQIRVSKMSDWRYEFLVAFHEILEMAWCHWQGVPQKDCDAFDIEYEKNRPKGDVSEPGDSPAAPYYFGHQVATVAERIAALTLGVDWAVYTKEVESL